MGFEIEVMDLCLADGARVVVEGLFTHAYESGSPSPRAVAQALLLSPLAEALPNLSNSAFTTLTAVLSWWLWRTGLLVGVAQCECDVVVAEVRVVTSCLRRERVLAKVGPHRCLRVFEKELCVVE